MPPATIPSVVDLCLRSMATNIVRHGKKFMEDGENSMLYRTAQVLFSDMILKEIEHIYRNDEVTDIAHFVYFTEFLYEGKENRDYQVYFKPSLKLIFNEYTTKVSLRLQLYHQPKIPDMLFRSLYCCKNLKSLQLHSCQFTSPQLLKVMEGHGLVEVDLLYSRSCTDTTFIDTLKSCPNLRVFKASGELITDKCLLSLCANNESLVTFSFCQDGGNCSSLGKNLIKLMLHGTLITKMGIACALQHLPMLEKFVDGGLWAPDFGCISGKRKRSSCLFRIDYHFVAHGICELQDAAIENCGSSLTLKLTSLVFDAFSWHQYSERVRSSCPNLNTFVCCLGPLRTLCRDLNDELETAKWIRREHNLGMGADLKEILLCLNQHSVRQFYTDGRAIIVSAHNNDEFDVPTSVCNLEQIHIRTLICVSAPVLRFFSKMLSKAYSVRSLTVSGRIAEESFMDALKVNAFNKLEELSFCYADLKKISVRQLIENGSQLKRITHCNCSNAENFEKEHQEMARRYNFSVDINEEEESSCYATVKYN